MLDWDYDTWHEPTMGIQVTTEIGAVFTLTCASSFGLEAHERGIDNFLARLG